MRRSIIVTTVIATLALPTSAKSFTEEQTSVIDRVVQAIVAGTNGNCPRLLTIDKEIVQELLTAGIAPDQQIDTIDEVFSTSTQIVRARYASNPNDFCKEAWRLVGPLGSHKRQLLKAN